jgi:hypothetical protein
MAENVWVPKARCRTKLEQELGPQNQVKISKMSVDDTKNYEYTSTSKFVDGECLGT